MKSYVARNSCKVLVGILQFDYIAFTVVHWSQVVLGISYMFSSLCPIVVKVGFSLSLKVEKKTLVTRQTKEIAPYHSWNFHR